MSPVFFSALLNRVLTVASQLLATQWLSPGDFGQYAVVVSFVNIFVIFQNGDLPRAAYQHHQYNKTDVLNSIGVLTVLGCIFISVLVYFFGVKKFSEVEGLLIIALVMPSLRAVGNVVLTGLAFDGEVKKIATASSAEGVTRSCLTIVLAYLDFGAWAPMLAEISAISVLVIVGGWGVKKMPPKILFPERVRKIFFISIACSIFVAIEKESAVLLIGLFSGNSLAGSYFMAIKISSQITILVSPVVFSEIVPKVFAGDMGNSKKWMAPVLKLLSLYFLIGLLTPLGMYIIWGDKWLDSATIIPLLSLAAAIRVFLSVCRAKIEAQGLGFYLMGISFVDAVLAVLVVCLGIYFESLMLLACGLIFQAVFLAVFSVLTLNRFRK